MPIRLLPRDPNYKPTDAEKKLLKEWETGVSVPPFLAALDKRSKRRKTTLDSALTGLQQARAEAAKQAGFVQDLFFNGWLDQCVEGADDPRQWTRASVLYENYVGIVRKFSQKQKRLEQQAALEALATETQWGRWMATRYPTKKRRTAGFYYPLRLK